MRKIESLIIFGSNGFVGTSFLNYLAQLPGDEKPGQIILVNRHKPQNPILQNLKETEIISVEQDLRFPIILNFKASHILNLAGDGSKNAYSAEAADNFIRICNNIANWIKTKEPTKVVHASSGACSYKLESDSNFASKKVFIDSRLEGEKFFRSAGIKSGIKVVNARLFTFLGLSLLNRTQYAAPSFIQEASREGVIKVIGNPQTIRSYMHEKNLSEWLHYCLTTESLGDVVNIGSSEPVTIRDLAEFISRKTGASIEYLPTNQTRTIYLPSNREGEESLCLPEGPRWFDIVTECLDRLKKK